MGLAAKSSCKQRGIAGLPAHLTRITNSEVRSRLGCDGVISQLWSQACQKLQEVKAQDPSNICVHPIAMEQLQSVIHDLQPSTSPGPGEPSDTVAPAPSALAEAIVCPECGIAFAVLKSIRQHRALNHGVKVQRQHDFDAAIHSVGGLPQCPRCRHQFQTWNGLRKHIEQGNFRALNAGPAPGAKATATSSDAVLNNPEAGALAVLRSSHALLLALTVLRLPMVLHPSAARLALVVLLLPARLLLALEVVLPSLLQLALAVLRLQVLLHLSDAWLALVVLLRSARLPLLALVLLCCSLLWRFCGRGEPFVVSLTFGCFF